MNVSLQLRLEHAHAIEVGNGSLLDSNEEFLRDDARHVLLMRQLFLRLSRLLLVGSALLFSIDSRLSSLKSLGFDQFGVSDFFVLLFLCLHRGQLLLLEHFHTGLLERLETEDVEHGLDLLVKVKQLDVGIENLCCLAVFLRRHLRLEQGYGGSVKVKLSSDAHFLRRWLIRQVLNILISLHVQVLSTHYWLWRRNVSIRINGYNALRCLINSSTIVIIVTPF